MGPESEEAAQWEDKKQRMQVATGEILNRKPLTLESTSAVEQVPTKAAESPPLEIFKIRAEKPWAARSGFTVVPLWVGDWTVCFWKLLPAWIFVWVCDLICCEQMFSVFIMLQARSVVCLFDPVEMHLCWQQHWHRQSPGTRTSLLQLACYPL